MPAPGRPEMVSRTWQVMKGRSAMAGGVDVDVVGLVGRCDLTVSSL